MKHTTCKPGAAVMLNGYCPAKVLRIFRERSVETINVMAQVQVTADTKVGPEGYTPGEILTIDAQLAVPRDCVQQTMTQLGWSSFTIEAGNTEIVDLKPPRAYPFRMTGYCSY